MKPAIIGGRLSAIAMIRVIYYRTESVDAGGGSHGAIIQVLPSGKVCCDMEPTYGFSRITAVWRFSCLRQK